MPRSARGFCGSCWKSTDSSGGGSAWMHIAPEAPLIKRFTDLLSDRYWRMRHRSRALREQTRDRQAFRPHFRSQEASQLQLRSDYPQPRSRAHPMRRRIRVDRTRAGSRSGRAPLFLGAGPRRRDPRGPVRRFVGGRATWSNSVRPITTGCSECEVCPKCSIASGERRRNTMSSRSSCLLRPR